MEHKAVTVAGYGGVGGDNLRVPHGDDTGNDTDHFTVERTVVAVGGGGCAYGHGVMGDCVSCVGYGPGTSARAEYKADNGTEDYADDDFKQAVDVRGWVGVCHGGDVIMM